LARDLGQELGVDLYCDASAGRSMAFRKGLGKVRHMDTKFLWIQDLVKTGRLSVLKIKGTRNPADVGTKYLTVAEMEEKLLSVGIELVKKC
jgi:hypothetical protein